MAVTAPLNLDRQEPTRLVRARRQALERFTATGFPGRRLESWRFTEHGLSADTPLNRAPDTPVAADRLPLPVSGDSHRLSFVNGRFAPGLSWLRNLPANALVASLGQALRTHPELVEAHLGQLPGLENQPFVDLNSAMWEDGAFVYLPAGTVLEAPLQLVYYASGTDTANYPRTLIVLGENTQATIVEDYLGEGAYLTCPVTEIDLAHNAILDYHALKHEADSARHLGAVRMRQAASSRLTGYFVSDSGLVSRSDLFTTLGPGAECALTGLTLVSEGQLGDYHVQMDHASAHASSKQLFKSVLEGRSRAVFDGIIKVHPQAQKSDASQQSRNLLLSPRAIADANPRLEILADDVKCSHGATIGFLDPEALFYLQSRGIGADEARALLVYAFANEAIEHMTLDLLRDRLEQRLSARLYPIALEG